jgi:uncharacterized protein (TIGR02145 family)
MKNKYFFMTIAILIIALSSSAQETGTFTDSRDGKMYKTVTIGSQTWMVENLNVNHYSNGDIIPEAKSAQEWMNYWKNKEGAWCYYNNDSSNRKLHGKLYNWYAVTDPRGIAPLGWHVPSGDDWIDLVQYLGGNSTAGSKLKSSTGWDHSTGTNSSGFSALPDGIRSNDGLFYKLGSYSYWWSNSAVDSYNTWCGGLNDDDDNFWGSNENFGSGIALRLIQD